MKHKILIRWNSPTKSQPEQPNKQKRNNIEMDNKMTQIEHNKFE